MAHKFIGSTEAQLQGTRKDWHRETGHQLVETWKGPESAIETKYQEVTDLALSDATSASKTPVSQGGSNVNSIFTLEVAYSDGPDETQNTEEDSSVWELVSNDLQIDIRQHPVFRDNVADADFRTADEAIKTDTDPGALGNAQADDYYTLRLKGVDFFVMSYPVIRRTVSRHKDNANFGTDYQNINRVVTLASINPPANILDDLAVFAIPTAEGGVAHTGLEWLKKSPRIRITNGYLVTVNYEFWGAEKWSARLYGGTGAP